MRQLNVITYLPALVGTRLQRNNKYIVDVNEEELTILWEWREREIAVREKREEVVERKRMKEKGREEKRKGKRKGKRKRRGKMQKKDKGRGIVEKGREWKRRKK